MKYIVVLKSKNMLANMEHTMLNHFKSGLEKAMEGGAIEHAYAKVGGGAILVLNSESNAALTRELRKHHITDAEVIPVVNFLDILDAHIEHRKTGNY